MRKPMTDRFVYSQHKTQEQAEDHLRDMFASGEVSEGEHPKVERRGFRSGRKVLFYYAVTLDW